MILSTINNPSSSEMVTENPKPKQAPLSSTVTIHQCLPCVQEGLSVLQRPKFSLCIGHFAGYELRHFTLSVLSVLRGETTPGWPGVTHSLSYFFCLCMTQSQQESISGQATWQSRQVLKKQRKIHEKPFKRRVASWHCVKF